MEIYSFLSPYNVAMDIIYALGAIVLGVMSFILVHFFVLQIKAYRQSGEKFPRRLTAFLIAFCFAPVVGTILFGNIFVKSVSYNIQMDRGNACYLEGDIELVSYEEHPYRDSSVGYDVVIAFNGKTIAPSNVFSKQMIDYFESNEKLIIQYGEIKNDGIYIWKICTVNE